MEKQKMTGEVITAERTGVLILSMTAEGMTAEGSVLILPMTAEERC